MRRREFIAGLGAVAVAPGVWPLEARAQQDGRMRRVGVLMTTPEGDAQTQARLEGFRQGLGKRGWSEGRNVRIDYRFAAGITDRYQPLAKVLLDLQPDVILADTTPVAAAFQRESRNHPDRVRQRLRSDRLGLGHEPGAAGRKSYRPPPFRR